MMRKSTTSLLAIDVGNSRVKLAWYSRRDDSSEALPTPDKFLELSEPADPEPLRQWTSILPLAETTCLLASVHRETTQWLTNQLAACGLATIRELNHNNLPLRIRTDHPEQVGIDRLLNAVTANHLRQPSRPAIVADIGTAITVDLIAADGAFEGGAILPGLHLSARALQLGTDVLPLVDLGTAGDRGQCDIPFLLPTADFSPNPLGKSTEAAIAAGLYWGAVGAVRELITRQSARCETQPELFITGGAAGQIAASLSKAEGNETPAHSPLSPVVFCPLSPSFLPHMVLAGIQITAQELS